MIRPTFSLRAGLAILATLIGVAAGCGIGGPSGAGWHDANLHVVDGIWITGEEPCDPTSDDDLCRAVRVAALERAGADNPETSPMPSVALARLPNKWFNAHGQQILMTTGGMAHPQVAIVDLADGRRLAVGLMCEATVTSDGQPARPASCIAAPEVLARYRVDGQGPNPFDDAP